MTRKREYEVFRKGSRQKMKTLSRVTRGNSGRGVIPVIEQYFFFKKIFKGDIVV